MHGSPGILARRARWGRFSPIPAAVLFLLVSFVSAQEPTEPQSAAASGSSRVAVHGVVRNAATGAPLARALVQIEGDAETGTLTDG